MPHALPRATPGTLLGSALLASTLACPTLAIAGFLDDSRADLGLTHYYFSHDFRDETSARPDQQSRREEWAQGFTLRYRSGYTDGVVGLGLDATGMLGLKLDSGAQRSGTGLLQQDAERQPGQPAHARKARDQYGKLDITAKAKVAQSELRIGTLMPELPVIRANTSRLFPSSYQGAQLTSSDIDGLTLTSGVIRSARARDSQDYQPLTLDVRNSRYAPRGDSERFVYAGGEYRFGKPVNASYYYAELEDFYRQHFVGLKSSMPLGPGTLGLESRYFSASDTGRRLAGQVDNDALGLQLGYAFKGMKGSLGHQRLYGDSAFPFINTSDAGLFSHSFVSNFSEAGERASFLRLDYDFAALGLPGLTFMTRYVKGDGARLRTTGQGGSEWERDTDIAYAFQKGSALENLSVRLRNATYRSQFQRDVDQTRLMITYSLPLF